MNRCSLNTLVYGVDFAFEITVGLSSSNHQYYRIDYSILLRS